MTLSIVIPCYKVESYLDKCLDSVCQYYTDEIEIILVDDGSPDSTPHLCDQWAEKDKRIKVIHQGNGGLNRRDRRLISQQSGISQRDWGGHSATTS